MEATANQKSIDCNAVQTGENTPDRRR